MSEMQPRRGIDYFRKQQVGFSRKRKFMYRVYLKMLSL